MKSLLKFSSLHDAQFATASAAANELYPWLWEAIKRLELSGLKVMLHQIVH